ncbi:hypothetical protein BDB00DRAFT_832595 [Zychaea mexicana]|uniref:uncharacterized protein n=1 Tax=Zychaea mexicana TaxID=64656 RepID=UPI0022FEF309|nr:uncharacterized protein BDB00DRAFT_832595 [Zychaea mexicana]KAI9491525.1 hypothetical protein BDB00DRAFT_832595 [Zychaea mexicana]
MIDKSTGKTFKEAYVELNTIEDVFVAIRRIKSPNIKGRRVYITKSTQEALFRAVFPEWDGMFIHDKPTFVDTEQDDGEEKMTTTTTVGCSLMMANHTTASTNATAVVPPLLVKPDEYEALLSICRNYKACFSRKCPERPFENFISIMVKFPWDTPDIITTMQRDHLYEYYKLATGMRFLFCYPTCIIFWLSDHQLLNTKYVCVIYIYI